MDSDNLGAEITLKASDLKMLINNSILELNNKKIVIAEKLVKGIENFGGEIRYKSKVKKIIFEKGNAIGVCRPKNEYESID